MPDYAKFLEVTALSMFKFLFAPFLGAKLGLSMWTTWAACMTGMNLSIFIFSFFGQKIKKFWATLFPSKREKLFSTKSRRTVAIWTKYGLYGIAFLTPPLFTPPVGAIIAASFGEPRQRIVLFMLISSLIWGTAFCFIAYELKEVSFLKKILG